MSAMASTLRNRRESLPESGRPSDRLTTREREVLVLLAGGRSVKEVAASLHISVFTLRGHIRGIITKLGVQSMTQAVSMAFRQGLIGGEPDPRGRSRDADRRA
jgi:DNA-binding NarL/FixJ family response regulator